MRATYKTCLLTLTLALFATSMAHSQFRNRTKEADMMYNSRRFHEAAEEYQIAYAKLTGGKTHIFEAKRYSAFRAGRSWHNVGMMENAEDWYKKAVVLKYYEKEPKVYLYLAEVQRQLLDMSDSKENLGKYLELVPGDEYARTMMEGLELSEQFKAKPTKHVVQAERKLNTPQIDMSPAIGDKKGSSLFFSSGRPASQGDEEHPRMGGGDQYMDIYWTEIDKNGNWLAPQPVANINTPDDEGPLTVDRRFKTMIFTRCPRPNEKNENIGCQLWMSEGKRGEWEEPVMLDLKDHDSTSIGHPLLSPDGDVLIFASNMAGGFGGLDLWMSTYDKRSDQWSVPENLGPTINTKGNEAFPTWGADGKTLCFASSGLPGMGGMDMFYAESTGENAWSNPKNFGYPLNSPQNDYGIVYLDASHGWFTSSRTGGTGRADLYNFSIPPVVIKAEVKVKDKTNLEPISNAELNMIGSDGSRISARTNELGQIAFTSEGDDAKIKKDVTYTIEASKGQDYLAAQGNFSTHTDDGITIVTEIFLQPVTKEIPMPEVRYDFAQSTLQVNDSVNSKDSLNYLYDVLVQNPTIVVELMAHTDCRGTDEKNMILSQARAEECVAYLVSKGIDKDRIVPKGYGETKPVQPKDKDGNPTGHAYDCDWIKKQGTKDEQEALHQKNRRTEFTILSWDFVPKEGSQN